MKQWPLFLISYRSRRHPFAYVCVLAVLAFMSTMVLSDMHRYETGYSLSPVHSLRAFVHVYVYMYMYICSMCGIMCSMCGFIFNLIKMGEWHAFGHATVLQGPPVGSPSGGPFPQLTYTLLNILVFLISL